MAEDQVLQDSQQLAKVNWACNSNAERGFSANANSTAGVESWS